ncbi:MAG: plastocyanin/azurin family copper-binding protein, partial [Betaproteobacteria bacterium]
TVPVNTTVKWTNIDTILHTVTGTTVPANGAFDVQVNPGASVCLKFTSAGTFNYHCSIHPTTMIGLVTVQ